MLVGLVLYSALLFLNLRLLVSCSEFKVFVGKTGLKMEFLRTIELKFHIIDDAASNSYRHRNTDDNGNWQNVGKFKNIFIFIEWISRKETVRLNIRPIGTKNTHGCCAFKFLTVYAQSRLDFTRQNNSDTGKRQFNGNGEIKLLSYEILTFRTRNFRFNMICLF